jgi:hypothetical protein
MMSVGGSRGDLTPKDVEKLVKDQMGNDGMLLNHHAIRLQEFLVPPRKLAIIVRTVRNGRVKDQIEDVWLIGQEASDEGYRVVMREDRAQFGLASSGFPSDKHLVLVGWYGGLKTTFLAM